MCLVLLYEKVFHVGLRERERSLFMKMWGGEGGNVKEKKRTLMRYRFSMKNNKG